MKRPVLILTLLWLCCCWTPITNAADADILWSRAVQLARQSQMDLAFSNFRLIVDTYPDYKHTPKAQLDLGEYYFTQHNWPMAAREFELAWQKYPKHTESIIALAYLYRIAEVSGQAMQRQTYKKYLFSEPLGLVFKDSRRVQYTSGFGYKYTIEYFIDKVEVYKNGELLVSVPA